MSTFSMNKKLQYTVHCTVYSTGIENDINYLVILGDTFNFIHYIIYCTVLYTVQ